MMDDKLYLRDGTVEYPYDMFDFLRIVEEQMGPESREYLESFLQDYTNFDIETGERKIKDESGEGDRSIFLDLLDRVRGMQIVIETKNKYRYRVLQELKDLEYFITAKL